MPSKAPARAALAALPQFAACLDSQIDLQTLGGLSNHSYLVTRRDDPQRYVLRLSGEDADHFVDRYNEQHNRQIAAQLGIAPPLLYANPKKGLQLSLYLAGAVPLTAAVLNRQPYLGRACVLLRQLHRSGAEFRGRLDIIATLDRYLQLTPLRWRLRLQPLRRRLKKLETELRPSRLDCQPCHGDPSPENFINVNGRLYLLDWEYATGTEPLWDLALLASAARLDRLARAHLLRRYFGRVDRFLKYRFDLFLAAADLTAAAWLAARYHDDSARSVALINQQLRRCQSRNAPKLGTRRRPAAAPTNNV